MGKKAKNGNGAQKRREKVPEPDNKSGSVLEFTLVNCMLGVLMILIISVIFLPFIVDINPANPEAFIDFSKWVLTALLAAFGAWIGAGAAYFFGKENLRESSRSTEQVLKIQQQASRGRLESAVIEDINPAPINPHFKFTTKNEVSDVIKKLEENVDYWFVPVIEAEKLKDIIHSEAFWRYYKSVQYEEKETKEEKNEIEDVIKFIETAEEVKQKKDKLRGFFLQVAMDDSVKTISNMMEREGVSVGVVCDKNGMPTHCFSRRDIRSFLLAGE
ncbi:MAG: CBS domain-containing protein [Candidatus Zixiibacteriota bacterium]|nr:MAG: CBS domain-containing protein [candidate division Zixibacteria bacterium]